MMFLGDPTIYWSLKLALTLILLFCGWGISYKDSEGNNFWRYAIFVIICYSLVEGLRWDRGQDYYHYYQDLTGDLFTDYQEPLYLWWIKLFKLTALPYWTAFVFYSALLITSLIWMIKKVPQTAVWALPLFYIITESQSENLIRQYLAIPFIFFAFYFCLKDKIKWMLASLAVVPFIHVTGLYAVILFLLFYFTKFKEYKISLPLLCILYTYMYFWWDSAYFGYITDLLGKINLGDDSFFQEYLDNSERWFSEEGSISLILGNGAYVVGPVLRTLAYLFGISTIYLGYKIKSNSSVTRIVYYMSIIALFFQAIGKDIEMYNRLANWTVYLYPLLIGFILYYCNVNDKYTRFVIPYAVIVVMRYYFFEVIRTIGTTPYHGCAFIWDI